MQVKKCLLNTDRVNWYCFSCHIKNTRQMNDQNMKRLIHLYRNYIVRSRHVVHTSYCVLCTRWYVVRKRYYVARHNFSKIKKVLDIPQYSLMDTGIIIFSIAIWLKSAVLYTISYIKQLIFFIRLLKFDFLCSFTGCMRYISWIIYYVFSTMGNHLLEWFGSPGTNL